MVRLAMTRRRFLAMSSAGAAGVLVPALRADAARLPSYASRASAAYKAMQKYFYVTNGSSMYRETYPRSGNPYSYLWPFSQAMAGTLDLYGVSPPGVALQDVQDRSRGLTRYWNPSSTPAGYDSYVRSPYGSGGDQFYDDHGWIGLNLVRLNRLTGDPTALAQAEQAFDLIVSGWDTDPADVPPGGVFWTKATWNRDRNTVANGPGAILGFRLYLLTNQQARYDWAKKMYDWVNTYLRDTDGLYWDHLDRAGHIDYTKWSYNQGSMIGANVLLYQIHRTTNPPAAAAYLADAERITDTALKFYKDSYASQGPAFNAIFFRNLLALHAVTADTALQAKILTDMRQYADTIWATNRNALNLFSYPPGASASKLLDQAATVELFAALAWNPTNYDGLL
jgi:hypothetical protein